MKTTIKIYIYSVSLLFSSFYTVSAVNAQSYEAVSPPNIMYYGADIGQFPPKVRGWIMTEGFPKWKMGKPSMNDPKLMAWWSDDGNEVFFEASYTIAEGYVGAGDRLKWGQEARYWGPDLNQYGEYGKYQSLKFQYIQKLKIEKVINSDPAYAEVITFAKQLSSEIEYDWSNYPAYKGAIPVKTPDMKYAVCSGYSNEVMEKVLTLKYVASVEEWVTKDHAWNVLNLVDGRKLYFDLTWFDNEHIDHETGLVYQTDDYSWGNITFDEEIFKYSNISYSGTTSHANGKFQRVLRK